MGEKINKEFEEYQRYLNIKDKKLRIQPNFNCNIDITKEFEEIKKKDIEV